MENLAASLLANVSLSDEALFNTIKGTPDLSYVKQPAKTSEEETDESVAHREIVEKASFLHVLEAVAVCHKDPKNRHEAACKAFLSQMNTQNSLKKLLTQFKEYKFIVVPETLLLLQTYDFAVMADDSYITEVVQTALSAPDYLSVLFCFVILQLLKVRKAYEAGTEVSKLPASISALLETELLSPILLASHLNSSDAAIVTKILYKFDVFDIIANRWIPAIQRVFGKAAQKVCYDECHYFVCMFLRLYHRSTSMMPMILSQRLLPVMSIAVRKSPGNFEQMINEYNVFSLKAMMDEKRFPYLIWFAGCACGSRKNAEEVLLHMTSKYAPEPLLKLYFGVLRQSLSSVVSDSVPDTVKWAMYLLKRLCKHLSANKLAKLIDCFDSNHPIAAFGNFLWNFLDNKELGRYAAQCLQHVAVYYPREICEVLSAWDFSVIAKYMKMSSQVATAFAKIARILLTNYYILNSQFAVLPSFVSFIVKTYFSEAMFQKYERRSKRWKTMFALLETGYDMCLFDKTFCSEVQNDPNFGRALIAIVQQTVSIIEKPPHETKENEFVRLDSDKPEAIIRFDCLAIALMSYLVEYNLTHEKTLSTLSTSFFAKNSDTSMLFSTLMSFLELTHPLTASIREAALKLLAVLCEVAKRMKNVNVDAFYPRQKQAILTEYVRANLMRGKDVNQMITALDFMANTFVTQTTFSYAFLRKLDTQKLTDISADCPRKLLALSKLLSRIFSRQSRNSKLLEEITSKPNFWSSVGDMIRKETDDLCVIASKAYLLHCWILGEQQIKEDMVRGIVAQILKVFPAARDPVILDFDIDLNKFLAVQIYPEYGPMFYIDYELVRRYLVDTEQTDLIEQIQRVNNDLSMIDACTQLISALLLLLKSANGIRVPVASISQIMSVALSNDLLPDSTAKRIFELLDFALETEAGDFVVAKSDIQALSYFVEQRPSDYSFKIIGKFVAASQVNANLGELLEFIEFTTKFGIENISKNAICCASEVALKLAKYDGWIEHAPIVCSSFSKLIETDIGVDVVDLFSVIAWNEVNASWLEMNGFFSLLDRLPCDDKCTSDLWPHLFKFLTALPKHSRVPSTFLGNHFARICFFMTPDAESEMGASKAFKTQLAITDLLAHIALYSSEFWEENPAILEGIQERVYGKMEHSLKYLRENAYVEFEGTLGCIDTYSDKLCNLCMLRNCLLFMNIRCDFPLGDFGKIVSESHTTHPLEEAMEKIMDLLHHALKGTDQVYAPVIIQTFELALRIFTGAIYKLGSDQMRENRDSVLRSIRNLTTAISKTGYSDIDSTQEFCDVVSAFLGNMC